MVKRQSFLSLALGLGLEQRKRSFVGRSGLAWGDLGLASGWLRAGGLGERFAQIAVPH